MHIVLVNEYALPHAPGGAERSMDRLARALAARGHRVRILTTGRSDAVSRERETTVDAALAKDGVTVERMRRRVWNRAGDGAAPSYVFGNPLFQLSFAAFVERSLAADKPDILHAQGYDSFAPTRRAARTHGAAAVATVRDYRALCPVSVCLHDQDRAPVGCERGDFLRCCALYRRQYDLHLGPTARVRHDVRRHLEWSDSRQQNRALGEMDGAIFVSARIRDIYRDAELVPQRTVVIPNLPPEPMDSNPVSERSAADPAVPPTILFLGRYSLGKGAAVLSRAMMILEERGSDARCVVVGRREHGGAGSNMTFIGQQSADEVRGWLRRARVVVVPSRWQEPLSRVLLESMEAGVPIVATNAGGNAEAVHDGENGFLVPRNDPEALAAALSRVVGLGEGERRAMGERGRQILERDFQPEQLLDRLEGFYAEVRA